LDRSDIEAVNLKSYPLRYGNAKTVVTLLNDMLVAPSGSTGPSLDSGLSQVAPGAGVSLSSSVANPVARLSALPTAGAGAATPITGPPGSPINARPAPPPSDTPLAGAAPKSVSGNNFLPNVRITADVTNNAVLVYANAESQRVVEQTIRQIDRPQRQVAIEATIAEVTLNNQLQYGVQFFVASQKGSIANTIATGANVTPLANSVEPPSNAVNAAAGALLGRVLPGFNFLIGSETS